MQHDDVWRGSGEPPEMRPYYEQDGVTIYHGDCLEIVADLPPCDLMVADPPFSMPAQHYDARVEWARVWGDTAILARWWGGALDVLAPKIKGTGSAFVFCDDESYPVFYPGLYTRFPGLSALVWNKGRIGMGSPWRHTHEFVLHARRPNAKWRGTRGETDVLAFAPVPSAQRVHPVDKPAALLAKLIAVTTDEGDLVLDPFMGGGSTLAAARTGNRRVIGIEIEEHYCEVAAKRLSQGQLDFGTPEDVADAAVAKERLAEIRDNPALIVSADELKRRLADIEGAA